MVRTDSNEDPLAKVDAQLVSEAKRIEPKHGLFKLVVLGTGAITLVGLALFFWIAWIESAQELSLFGWMSHVDGDGWFNAARTSATFLAVVGVGGAAIVGYRKQQNAELIRTLEQRRHIVAQRAQATAARQAEISGEQAQTAADQLQLDSKKYDLDRQRQELDSKKYELDRERQQHEHERNLRDRFAVVVSQLGSESATEQNAGMYTLAALADDWASIGNKLEMQVCIDMFCGHLRGASVKSADEDERILAGGEVAELVLQTGASILRRQLRAGGGWATIVDKRNLLDLTGVYFASEDLSYLDLQYANFTKADLRSAKFDDSNLSHANLADANLSNAWMWGVKLKHADCQHADMRKTTLDYADVSDATLTWVNLTGASVNDAKFKRADFYGAKLDELDFDDPYRGKPSFEEVVDLHAASFSPEFAAAFASEIEESRKSRLD